MAFGVCTNCSSSFPPSTGQKWNILQNIFFDIVTTYNDEICYVKHVLDPLCVFFTLFGCWGGGYPGHTTCSYPALAAQKWKFSETDFLDTLTIQKDQISYVKHVLDPLCVFFTLFGCVCGGGYQGV